MSSNFAHLHVHTEYSVLDGASRVQELLQRCQEYGQKACAITDHGALFGVLDFYEQARKAGVKPIIGCELYVAKGHRTDRSGRSGKDAYNHFLLLCENNEGYHNLCKLSSLGYLEGYHYKPRVDLELLAKYSGGLIATSACLAGEIPQLLLNGEHDRANEAIEKYVDIYGKDNFLIEIMDHELPEQRQINPMLAEMAEHHGLLVIATNDCHYVDREDAEAHEALLCVQTAGRLDDEKHFRFPAPEFYLRSTEEMEERFSHWPEALENTGKIAERCNVEIPLGQHLIPEYVPPEGRGKPEYLRHLVTEGLKERYGTPDEDLLARAEFELGVIESMGFVDYFLVVWDLINHAREKHIPVGPGRGSGAGSIVAYALRITNIDPIKYKLLFERFLNPERVSMPDFDLDFCYRRREEMIDYVREKYGDDNVSQIITFGRMLAKNVIRNVGRVMGMSYGDVDRIAKLVPDELKITLKDAHEREPELQRLVKEDEQVAQLWKLASRLEGTIGNCGTHAAGVVICDDPLMDHVPLFRASNSEVVATQFEMKGVEEVGLLKMDFLGLRTLTVIHDAVRFIRENKGVDIDIDEISTDDPAAYALLRSGKTTGVFQLESSGMRELAKRIGLESLEEICALIALYRPGPMQLKDEYIENKHNPSKITYSHPILEPILKETYGIALYQEQVMEMARSIAGFTLGQADILRRAMGKKKAELMAEQRAAFLSGAKNQGIGEETADTLFNKIEQFAGYGFNKSHSMAYAFVAYQTAYLKANYPAEFMAALLTSESNNLDKVAVYVAECRQLGIDVLPPDVNRSYSWFSVEGDAIRFGLRAIKNVGEGPVDAIVREREQGGPFEDIFGFCERMADNAVNRRVLESLNRAGAFESTGWNRREVEEALDQALQEAQAASKDRANGQTSLFDLMAGDGGGAPQRPKPELEEWPEAELLAAEKEMLGLYVSSHPLAKHQEALERFTNVDLLNLEELREGQDAVLGGLITHVKLHTTARGGKKMAFVTIDTLQGPCEFTVFNDVFEQRAGLLVEDTVVIAPSRVSYRNDTPSFLASDVLPVEDAESQLTKAVHIRLSTVGLEETLLNSLAEILGSAAGPCDVYLHCVTPDEGEVTVHATEACRVAPSAELQHQVEDLLGPGALWFSGGNGYPRHN